MYPADTTPTARAAIALELIAQATERVIDSLGRIADAIESQARQGETLMRNARDSFAQAEVALKLQDSPELPPDLIGFFRGLFEDPGGG